MSTFLPVDSNEPDLECVSPLSADLQIIWMWTGSISTITGQFPPVAYDNGRLTTSSTRNMRRAISIKIRPWQTDAWRQSAHWSHKHNILCNPELLRPHLDELGPSFHSGRRFGSEYRGESEAAYIVLGGKGCATPVPQSKIRHRAYLWSMHGGSAHISMRNLSDSGDRTEDGSNHSLRRHSSRPRGFEAILLVALFMFSTFGI